MSSLKSQADNRLYELYNYADHVDRLTKCAQVDVKNGDFANALGSLRMADREDHMSKETRTIRGEPHALVVLKVNGRDVNGRPKEATLLYDEESVDVDDGDEFLTCYVPARCVAKRSN